MGHKDQSSNFIHDALLSIPKFGEGVGLHRMSWLMQRLQSEQPCAFKAIKVTGSNGKGSVCAMLSAMMEQINLQHGLYTSPHLFRFNERIRFGRQEINDEELIESINWLDNQKLSFQQEFPSDRIGAFEAFTAIALHAYAKRNIEYLVSEAGIGGRYDATRMIPGHIAALTSLDLEHTHLLGNTLELIAYDKADLCPPGGVLVTGLMEASLERRLATYCAVNGIRMVPAISRCQVQRCRYEAMSMQMDSQVDIHVDGLVYSDISLNMIGQHQQRNAEVAITTFLEWLDRYQAVKLTGSALETVIRNALEKVVWHGRCSLVHTDPSIFIDVGHSPMAVSAAMAGFRDIIDGKSVLLVTGVSYDKDILGILRHILPIADEIIATRAYHNGSKVEDIYRIVKEEAPTKLVTKAATIELAMQMAKARAQEQGMVVVVAGGLFLSIEAEAALSGKNPNELRFF